MEVNGRFLKYSQFQDEDIKLLRSVVQGDGAYEGGVLQAAEQLILPLGG